MKYITQLENNIVLVTYRSGMGFAKFKELIDECIHFGECYEGKFNQLLDLTQLNTYEILAGNFSSRSLYHKLQRHAAKHGYIRKEAIFGSNSTALNSSINLAMMISGRKNVRIFDNREDALKWIKQ